MIKSRVVSALAAVLAIVGCSDSSTEKEVRNAAVTLKIVARSTSVDSLVMRDSQGLVLTADTAFIHVRSLLLKLPTGVSAQSVVALNGGNARVVADTAGVRVQGPLVFNLLTGQATPPLEPIILPPGEYNQLSLQLDERDEQYGANEGDWMYNRSFVLHAGYVESEEYTALIGLSFGMELDIVALCSGGVTLRDGDRRTLAANFAVDSWFSGVNIEECRGFGGLSFEDGRMIIDGSESDGMCNGADDAIRGAIEQSCSLVEEQD